MGIKHVKALCLPRRTGSPGEVQAQNYIVNSFKALGMETREEEFSFCAFMGLLSKGFLLLVLFLLTTLHFLAPFFPLLRLILSLFILLLSLMFLWGKPIVSLLGWGLFKEIPYLKRLQSKNIVATWPELVEGLRRDPVPSDDKIKAHIYILAHYDSKSQTVPLGLRIPMVAILFLSTMLLAGYHLLLPWTHFSPQGLPERISFVMALTSGLILFWTKTRNLSPGAIDNATGVAVMLQLAEVIKKEAKRFKGLRFNFIATGAEEEGLVGAFWFLKTHRPDSENTYFINLDGVGTRGRIYCTGKIGLHGYSQKQKGFLSLIEKAARKEGMKVYSPAVVIGAMADHFPLVARGRKAVTFSTVSRRSLWVHTPWDTLETVEPEGMKAVEGVVLGILKSLTIS